MKKENCRVSPVRYGTPEKRRNESCRPENGKPENEATCKKGGKKMKRQTVVRRRRIRIWNEINEVSFLFGTPILKNKN